LHSGLYFQVLYYGVLLDFLRHLHPGRHFKVLYVAA